MKAKNWNILLICILFFSGCDNSLLRWNLPKLASVQTFVPEKISISSVQCSGKVFDDGGSFVTEKGICYSTASNPTIQDNKVVSGNGTGTFSLRIEGLSPNTNYYFRAYAITKTGISYGNETTLKTGSLPVVTTTAATSVTATTAITGGSITVSDTSRIMERGICYGTTQNPVITGNKIISTRDSVSFSVNISGLTPGTTYYARAYATNVWGTAYGNEISFTTASIVHASLTTTAASSITNNSAASGGNITSDGGIPVTERGICYGTSANPTISDNKITGGSGTGSYSLTITNLSSGTLYYVRAYATNTTGTTYGNEISFTTTSVVLPVLTTTAASAVTTNSAVSGGNITSDGGSSITARGICYSTTQNPTTADKKVTGGTGSGNFTLTISDLAQGTTYYVRAYAVNISGTSYGNEISFTTIALNLPVITTTPANSITTTSLVTGGNVTNDGGSAVTERGICYSISSNPTVSDHKIAAGSGTGNYIVTITGLIPRTTYYIRAYAINSVGINYGDQITAITGSLFLPVLTTSDVTSVTNNSAVSGGNITYDGGGAITERGICFSTAPSATVSDRKITGGSGTGTFSITLTGLTSGTSYYLRAYAVNSAGTAYGNEISFKTLTDIQVGSPMEGGIIFYLDGTGKHGLIAAPFDQSSSAKWGCSGRGISNSDATSLGSGLNNTISIVTGCSDSGTAAKICYNLTLNGYNDWYLPSKDELNLMYTNLKKNGAGGFLDTDYWSSSQESNKNSWSQSFSSGKATSKNKNTSLYVRAIRSF